MEDASVVQILEEYNEELLKVHSQGLAKPDMIAYSKLRGRIQPPKAYGHILNIPPGRAFNNRGELAILNLHSKMMAGIDSVAADTLGAYAIVMSGGYKDDIDAGEEFWYTGEGGQKGGQQVCDQTWTKGNLGLKRSYETGTPVRVFRGSKHPVTNARQYVYEGLYKVVEAVSRPSSDGPIVCAFKMKGVEGESKASAKVVFRALNAATTQFRRLGTARKLASTSGSHKRKRNMAAAVSLNTRREQILKELDREPGLLCKDISNGLEPLPIPVFNTLDNEPCPEIVYIKDYIWQDGLKERVQPILDHYSAKMTEFLGAAATCGVAHAESVYEQLKSRKSELTPDQIRVYEMPGPTDDAGQAMFYNPSGCLVVTESFGVHECTDTCKGVKCKRNRVVENGMTCALEVRKTAGKGWGVFAREEIPAGAYVTSYIGKLVHDTETGKDLYLFNLDHFNMVRQEMEEHERELPIPDLLKCKLPPFPNPNDPIYSEVEIPTASTSKPTSEPDAPSANGVEASTSEAKAEAEEGGDETAPTDAPAEEHEEALLVIDAMKYSNIARFINHSCDGNLAIQPVFTKDARSTVLYYVALFAVCDIAKGEELSYNYGYSKPSNHSSTLNLGIQCQCGAANCCGRLL